MKNLLIVGGLIASVTLVACGPTAVDHLTAPVYAALDSITTNATNVLESGSEPQDPRVETIVKEAAVAEKATKVMAKEYVVVTMTITKAKHRIFVDDCIFGAVAAAILIPIGIKLLPFLMAL